MVCNEDLRKALLEGINSRSKAKAPAEANIRMMQDEIMAQAHNKLSEAPLVLVIIGPSGAGKSSTIKALFGVNCEISHTVSCTKEFTPYDVELMGRTTDGRTIPVKLKVVDCPGLGESWELDDRYIHEYLNWVPRADVILWISDATVRAVSHEQIWLNDLAPTAAKFNKQIVFALNKIDLVNGYTPQSLKFGFQEEEQERNATIIVQDRMQKFTKALHDRGCKEIVVEQMVPYASARPETLSDLLLAIMQSTPRGHLFHAISEDFAERFMNQHADVFSSKSGTNRRPPRAERRG